MNDYLYNLSPFQIQQLIDNNEKLKRQNRKLKNKIKYLIETSYPLVINKIKNKGI